MSNLDIVFMYCSFSSVLKIQLCDYLTKNILPSYEKKSI